MCTLYIHLRLLLCYRFFSHLSAKTRLRNEKSTVAPVALTINGVEFHSCRAGMELST